MIFDGTCNLCHGAVRFIVKRDKQRRFRFASIQSEIACQILAEQGIVVDLEDLRSFYLVDESGVQAQSEAALAVVSHLDGLWPILKIVKWFPRALRDWGYHQIASRRYRLFGRSACSLPTEVDRSRFLD